MKSFWTQLQLGSLIFRYEEVPDCQYKKRGLTNSKKSNTETTFVIGEKECHIAPIIWPMFGDKHETHQVRALKDWLKARLL
jgi:hypothetical protein